jgi:ribose transport system permease protein
VTAAAQPVETKSGSFNWRTLLRDQPLIPLSVLLLSLAIIVWAVAPATRNLGWVAVILRASVPLAILAGCQTLTMLTGGIDLSVGYVASMAGFVTSTFVNQPGGWVLGVIVALVAALIVGLINGIGVGVFKVHPLIVTLGMGLVVLGFSNVWQLKTLQSGIGVPPDLRNLGSNLFADIVPFSLIVFVPVALIIIFGLRRTGYGRMLFALGDNATAARLSGVRSWQVLVVLYVISALLAAIAGLIYAGLSNTASVTLVEEQLLPCIAAAVIGGTSIAGGRGTFVGTILGAVILSVLGALLTILLLPEPFRQIVFGTIVVLVAAAYTRATSEA